MPEDIEEKTVETRDYRGYWAGITIGLSLVFIFALAGHFGTFGNKKKHHNDDRESKIIKARKAGDVEASGVLSQVFSSTTDQHVDNMISTYRKGLPNKSLSLRIAVAKRVFYKTSDLTLLKDLKSSDRAVWTDILSKKSIPHFQVSTYLQSVEREELGPLRLPALALVYEKSGDRVKSNLLMQQAKEDAWKRIALFGVMIGGVVLFFIVGVIFIAVGSESIHRLPPFTFAEEFPNAFVFPRYLLGYYISPILIYSGMSAYIGQAMIFPVAMLFAQAVGLFLLSPAGIAARFRPVGSFRLQVGLAISGLSTTLPVHVIAMLISYAIVHKAPHDNSLTVYLSNSGIPCVLTAISIVLIGPFIEELAFRGVLLDSLQEKLSFWPAAVISSMAFSALHLDFAFRFIPMFFFGLVMCYLRRRSGSLVSPLIAHIINNGLVTALFFAM